MQYGPRITTNGLYICMDAAPIESNNEGFNLVNNGLGFSGNNTNFSQFVFDTIDKHGASGSFRYSGAPNTLLSNSFFAVDTGSTYFQAAWIKAGETNGSGYYTNNRVYFGVICYDADFRSIDTQFFLKVTNSQDTTLAATLSSGDTTITLTNGSGWSLSTGVPAFSRQMQWWPYTNLSGYTYPDYTYTRNTTYDLNSDYYQASGCWSSRTGNVLYLTRPWPGPTLNSGTAVSNGSLGSTYNYNVLSNTQVGSGWSFYTGFIGGIDTDRNGASTEFRPGTEYAKIMILANYSSTGPLPSDATVRYSDIIFRKIQGNSWTNLANTRINGTLRNSVVYDGRISPSMFFNGVDDYISMNNVESFGNTFTILAFIKLNEANSDTIIYGSNSNGADNWFGINANRLYAFFTETNDINNSSLTGSTTLQNNIYYHVALTINGSTVKMYLNGIEDASTTVAFTIGAWGSSLDSIGRRGNTAQRYLKGNIGNLCIYNTVLTQDQILQNFNNIRRRFNI